MATLHSSAYTVDAPLTVFNRAMSLRKKAQGDRSLWNPNTEIEWLVTNKKRLLNLRKDAVKFDKQTLAELHSNLLTICRHKLDDLLISPVKSSQEQEYNQEFTLFYKLIQEFIAEIGSMVNSTEPDENSDDFNQFLSEIAQKAMAKGKRISGKKALMALFD